MQPKIVSNLTKVHSFRSSVCTPYVRSVGNLLKMAKWFQFCDRTVDKFEEIMDANPLMLDVPTDFWNQSPSILNQNPGTKLEPPHELEAPTIFYQWMTDLFVVCSIFALLDRWVSKAVISGSHHSKGFYLSLRLCSHDENEPWVHLQKFNHHLLRLRLVLSWSKEFKIWVVQK